VKSSCWNCAASLPLGGSAPTLGPAGGGTTHALDNSAAASAAARPIQAIAVTPRPEGAAASCFRLLSVCAAADAMANHDLGRRAGATCASSFAEFDVLIARHSAQEN
jgi:hypothetical protein